MHGISSHQSSVRERYETVSGQARCADQSKGFDQNTGFASEVRTASRAFEVRDREKGDRKWLEHSEIATVRIASREVVS